MAARHSKLSTSVVELFDGYAPKFDVLQSWMRGLVNHSPVITSKDEGSEHFSTSQSKPRTFVLELFDDNIRIAPS